MQPRTIRPVWSPTRRRRTFAAQLFGRSPDRTVSSLKSYLFQAKLTPSMDEKLDLVMVDDYEHFAELVAEHGVPLMRDDVTQVIQYVHVQRCWFWAFIATLPFLLLLAGGQLWDLLPWK